MKPKKQTKYKSIVDFSKSIGLSRSGAYKALEANDANMWGKYAAFIEEHNRRQLTALQEAKARVSNAKPVSKSKIAAIVAAQ